MKNENLVQTLLSTAQDFDDIKKRNATYLSLVPVKESEVKVNPKQPTYETTDDKGKKPSVK